jgi:hypothetical protein
LTTNFNNAAGLNVAPGQTNVSYLQLLNQSGDQPFETSLIRIQSTNASQVTQIITITSLDANGQSVSIPLITSSYFSAYQQQSGIMDIPYALRIDGNVYLNFLVLANATVTLTFFPAAKVNSARDLSGKGQVQPYGAPAVNVGGVVSIPRQFGRPVKRIGG